MRPVQLYIKCKDWYQRYIYIYTTLEICSVTWFPKHSQEEINRNTQQTSSAIIYRNEIYDINENKQDLSE